MDGIYDAFEFEIKFPLTAAETVKRATFALFFQVEFKVTLSGRYYVESNTDFNAIYGISSKLKCT
jgi:hypothetical protein